MTEQVYCFGPDEGLVGVMTDPALERSQPDTPAVLWLNSGLLHHVGPFGWYATLARRLADQGVLSFRFDLSGIGDSAPRNDGRDKLEGAIADVTEAMDLLARERSVRRFILVGLCSGAILAHHVAARDDRVAGAAFIDGYRHRTTGYYLRHYARRLFRWRAWANAGRRLVGVGANRSSATQDQRLLSREYFFEFPPPERARELLATALGRGTRLMFLYTGSLESSYNHRRQFEEMFGQLDPGGDRVEVEYMQEADHLFSGREQRLAMFDRVENWIGRMR